MNPCGPAAPREAVRQPGPAGLLGPPAVQLSGQFLPPLVVQAPGEVGMHDGSSLSGSAWRFYVLGVPGAPGTSGASGASAAPGPPAIPGAPSSPAAPAGGTGVLGRCSNG